MIDRISLVELGSGSGRQVDILKISGLHIEVVLTGEAEYLP